MTTGAEGAAISSAAQGNPAELNPSSAQRVGTLLSVNVGLPKNVAWQGRTVFTGVFKSPVPGPRRVGRLNVDGDGQGDLEGHGGEQRAVFVYQIGSYHYWERELGRHDFVYGQFGENFTVEGLGDDEACIGDRYRIGSATFEVTQPRVTCYRVGIRMNDPRIPALLVSHHRPGFYFRVLEEGEVRAGDGIVKLSAGPEHMSVADVDALLYLPGHERQDLLRALRVPALSRGWQKSFRALLNEEPGGGNAGLAVTSPPPAWPGFRQLTVSAITHESDSAISIRLEDPTGVQLPAARPGQYVTVRAQPDKAQPPLLREYSLSGPPGAGYYRITVKREVGGSVSGYLHTQLSVGDQLDIAAPRGTFILDQTDAPVLLVSAGIGVTPVLAMLQSLAGERSEREIWWLHGARDSREQSFAAEARALALLTAEGEGPRVLQPAWPGRRARARLRQRGTYYRLVARRTEATLRCRGVCMWARCLHGRHQRRLGRLRAGRIPDPHRSVRAAAGLTPGIASTPARAPHPPPGQPGDGPEDRLCPKRSHRLVEQRISEPPRTGGIVRRARSVVVPNGRLPDLPDNARRGGCRLQPRPGRTSGPRERADLLLAATWGHSPRFVRVTGQALALDTARPVYPTGSNGWVKERLSPCGA